MKGRSGTAPTTSQKIPLQAALLLNLDRDAKPAPIRDQLLHGTLSSHPPARLKVVRYAWMVSKWGWAGAGLAASASKKT